MASSKRPPTLSVREMREADVDDIIYYWLESDDTYLLSVGADLSKMPGREDWDSSVRHQLQTPALEKQSLA